MALLFLLLLVVDRLAVDLEEAVELDDLAIGDELLAGAADGDVDRCLLDLGISHLTGDGALPDEFVELALLGGTFYLGTVHIGGTDGFVSLLGTLRTGVVLAHFGVFLAVELADFLLGGVDAQSGEVYRVGTHIGNLSVLVEVLGNHHGLADRKAQLAGGLLLEGRGGEGRCRRTLHGLLAHAIDGKGCLLALLQELRHLVVRLHALCQGGLHLGLRAVAVGDGKDGVDAVIGLAGERLYLTLTLDNEAYGHTLHTTCRQGGLHLTPQDGRQLETYQAVEHTASLLGID